MSTFKGFVAGAFTTVATVFAVTPSSMYMDTNTLETNPSKIATTMDTSSLTTPRECFSKAENTVESYRNFVMMSERVSSLDASNHKEVTDIANAFVDAGFANEVDNEKLRYIVFFDPHSGTDYDMAEYQYERDYENGHDPHTPFETYDYDMETVKSDFEKRLAVIGQEFGNKIRNETLVTQAALTNCTIENAAEQIAEDNRDTNERARLAPVARIMTHEFGRG